MEISRNIIKSHYSGLIFFGGGIVNRINETPEMLSMDHGFCFQIPFACNPPLMRDHAPQQYSITGNIYAMFVYLYNISLSPRDLRIAGSNPTEVDGLLQDIKILSTSPPGGTKLVGPDTEISGSLKNLKPEKIGL